MEIIKNEEPDLKIDAPRIFYTPCTTRELTSGEGSVCLAALIDPAISISPEMPVRDAIMKMLDIDDPITAIVVVSEEKPVGLISSLSIERILSKRFGVDLFYAKPVSRIMDQDPLKVEADIPLDVAADLAMKREKAKLFDHVIVIQNESLLGTVSVPKMLETLARLERARREQLSRLNGGPSATPST